MSIWSRICRVIKGTIGRLDRCIALAGMAFGIVGFIVLAVLIYLAITNPDQLAVMAPLLLYCFLAIMALLALIVAAFLGFRNLEVGASMTGVNFKANRDEARGRRWDRNHDEEATWPDNPENP